MVVTKQQCCAGNSNGWISGVRAQQGRGQCGGRQLLVRRTALQSKAGKAAAAEGRFIAARGAAAQLG